MKKAPRPEGALLPVRVEPRARQDEVVGWRGGRGGGGGGGGGAPEAGSGGAAAPPRGVAAGRGRAARRRGRGPLSRLRGAGAGPRTQTSGPLLVGGGAPVAASRIGSGNM